MKKSGLIALEKGKLDKNTKKNSKSRDKITKQNLENLHLS